MWTHDEAAGAWYMHRFYEHQADLNISNPAVREEIQRIMGFWLELGVEGFRIDAVPFLVEYKGLEEEPDRDPLLLLSEMRDFLSWRRAGAIMLAEANVPRDRAGAYFGGRAFGASERMHMIFDFPLNQAIYLALVRGEAEPVAKALRSRPPEAPVQAQWANFLRNHDELSLDKLTEAERAEVFEAFAPEEGMRIYDRGIRRRLAPMLGGDERRLAMLHALLFALPGTPVLWYGDEIGQGEDLSLGERNPVRTPMQWSGGHQGGFSQADELVRPVVREGPMGFERTNVADQRDRPDSLLARVQRMVRARRGAPEIGWGETRVLPVEHPAVLALCSSWRDGRVVTMHNLADEPVRVGCGLEEDEPLVPLLGSADPQPVRAGEPVELGPFGYAWFRVGGERR